MEAPVIQPHFIYQRFGAVLSEPVMVTAVPWDTFWFAGRGSLESFFFWNCVSAALTTFCFFLIQC